MHKLYIPFLIGTLWLVSCNNNGTKTDDKSTAANTVTQPTAPPQSKLNDQGTTMLMSVVTDYYGIKDAFVATNANQADSFGHKLLTNAGNMRDYLKNDSANGKALTPYLDTILTQANELVSAKDSTCDLKRVPFGKISDQMFALLKNADLKNAGVYREYCPMAFDEKGGYWLSNDPEIKNPYFGHKMLDCGDVEDSLK